MSAISGRQVLCIIGVSSLLLFVFCVNRFIQSLDTLWENLQELANAREKKLIAWLAVQGFIRYGVRRCCLFLPLVKIYKKSTVPSDTVGLPGGMMQISLWQELRTFSCFLSSWSCGSVTCGISLQCIVC